MRTVNLSVFTLFLTGSLIPLPFAEGGVSYTPAPIQVDGLPDAQWGWAPVLELGNSIQLFDMLDPEGGLNRRAP